MTEQTNFADVNTGSQDSQVTAAPVSNSAPSSTNVSQATSNEQVPSQSQDYSWIGKEKAAAERRGYEKALKELQPSQQQSQPQQMGGMQQMSPEQLDQLIEQRLQQREQQRQSLDVANSFLHKLSQGNETVYPDYKEVMSAFNLQKFVESAPAVFHLVNSAKNTASVMYELANNPKKVAELQYTASMNPVKARRDFEALVESIDVNEKAKQQPAAQEPLGQIKPSTVGVDNGTMTVRDLKQLKWLRG